MINITFASIKNHKQTYAPTTKIKVHKKLDHPMTFKEIKELKQASNHKNNTINNQSRHLENQENTFSNIVQDNNHQQRTKPFVKYQKKNKPQQNPFKSPSSKLLGLNHSPFKERTFQNSGQSKRVLQSQKIIENHTQMTPCLNKVTRSMTTDENNNQVCYLTEKQRQNESSEQGSISISSKNSFNDSFQLYSHDLSYEEDQKSNKEGLDNQVNSSLELSRDPSLNFINGQYINELSKNDYEIKNMKKSTTLFCTNNAYAGQKCLSTVSSNISHSINFSQKFKHYKRQNIKSQKKVQTALRLCQFKLLDQIGSGKYGKVYLARHKLTGFVCAIKSVSKKIIQQQKLQIAFMREVKIQMYLNHPNIVRLYGFFCDEENIYLIMEYCSDGHLFKFIRQRSTIPQHEILSILSNLYQAVSFIHCHGIIHRDLKPQNVVVQHGVFKLCDFGWAAYSCGDNRTTFCGTPLYVCPQVLKGEQYNEKADIWGLGIITYELMFGRVPFSIINQSDLMKIIKDPVYFPAWGYASENLVPFIKRMLNKDPEMRPSLSQILTSNVFRAFNQQASSAYRSVLKELL